MVCKLITVKNNKSFLVGNFKMTNSNKQQKGRRNVTPVLHFKTQFSVSNVKQKVIVYYETPVYMNVIIFYWLRTWTSFVYNLFIFYSIYFIFVYFSSLTKGKIKEAYKNKVGREITPEEKNALNQALKNILTDINSVS